MKLPFSGKSAEERNAELIVLGAFSVTGVCGLALLVVYALGGQTQVEGLLLTGTLGGLGVGIVTWGQRLMPTRVHIEERGRLGSGDETLAVLQESLEEEAGFSRRKLLIGALVGALGSLAAALAIPILSLGPAPGRSLFVTTWRAGRRLAPPGGPPTKATDIPVGGVLTVFPDGDTSDPNAATLLINLGTGFTVQPPPGATSQSMPARPDQWLALSKICTHAGCPVGLYRESQHVLICPCHQSQFDVLRGAAPFSGPAARPLPELPFRMEDDGTFTALGDFPEPVGPSFWDMRL
jgi:quinol---cytochrome c reductase iron-sulfur subunit